MSKIFSAKYITPFFLILLSLAIAMPYIYSWDDSYILISDTADSTVPILESSAQTLEKHGISYWNQYMMGGYDRLAANEKHTGFSQILFLLFSPALAYKIYILSYCVVSMFGSFLLVKTETDSRLLAIVLAFSYSSHYLSYNHLGGHMAYAVLPWILWLFHEMMTQWKEKLSLPIKTFIYLLMGFAYCAFFSAEATTSPFTLMFIAVYLALYSKEKIKSTFFPLVLFFSGMLIPLFHVTKAVIDNVPDSHRFGNDLSDFANNMMAFYKGNEPDNILDLIVYVAKLFYWKIMTIPGYMIARFDQASDLIAIPGIFNFSSIYGSPYFIFCVSLYACMIISLFFMVVTTLKQKQYFSLISTPVILIFPLIFYYFEVLLRYCLGFIVPASINAMRMTRISDGTMLFVILVVARYYFCATNLSFLLSNKNYSFVSVSEKQKSKTLGGGEPPPNSPHPLFLKLLKIKRGFGGFIPQGFGFVFLPEGRHVRYPSIALLIMLLAGGMISSGYDFYESQELLKRIGTQKDILGNKELIDLANFLKKEYPAPFRIAVISNQGYFPAYFVNYGLETINGYIPLYSKRFRQFWEKIIKLSYFGVFKNHEAYFGFLNINANLTYQLKDIANIELLRLSNTHFIFSPFKLFDQELELVRSVVFRECSSQSGFIEGSSIRLGHDDCLTGKQILYVYKLTHAVPRYFAVFNEMVIDQSDELLKMMGTLPIDELQQSVFSQSQTGLKELKTYGGNATIELLSNQPDKTILRVNMDRPGILINISNYNKAWKAQRDGQPAEVFPAYHTYMGVVIPKSGESIVSFSYEPYHANTFYSKILMKISKFILNQ